MNILEIKAINSYYEHAHILHEVSLEVKEGSITGILGRNGAGKTTTLRSIMGLTPPRTGSVEFRGSDIKGLAAYRIADLGIGYVPDDRQIFPDLTVFENLKVAEPRRMRREKPAWNLERVYRLFPVLEQMASKGGTETSGGEQKMLAIGRALMRDPDLLLLDEPTEGLAPMVVKSLIEAILEIRSEGVTLLVADQNVKFARQLIETGYIIDKGAIQHQGPMKEIWESQEIVRKYLAV